MQVLLHFGNHTPLEFEVSDEALLYIHGRDAQKNLSFQELSQEILAALEEPLEYAPLRESLLDEDHLVIPVSPGIPQIELILKTVLEYIFTAPTVHIPAKITILRTHDDETAGIPKIENILPSLPSNAGVSPEEMKKRIEIQTHHPENRDEMAFLGVDETNETLVIHRKMFDAEVVLPIGFFEPKGTPGHVGVHTPIYPMFSDEITHKRYKEFGPQMHESNHELMHQLEHEITEATRQLGVSCMLQIVPGIPEEGTSGIARVLAGDYREVESDGWSRYCEIWTNENEKRADVVVATLNGSDASSWTCAARALEHAASIAKQEEGAIVLCSALSGELPRFLQIFAQVQNYDTAMKFIRREELPNVTLAEKMLRVLTQYRVFFLSQMDAEVLEEINVFPLESASDLERLIANNGTCVILPDAHRMII